MTPGAGARLVAMHPPKRDRLLGADAVRAVGMLGVVLIHASAWGPRAPFHAIEQIARFSVPAFLVLTGVVLAYSYAGRRLGPGFARRRLARTLLPWLAWAPVFVVFDVLTGSLSPDATDVGSFVVQGAGHLWFLLLVPQLYLLFAIWPRHHRWSLAAAALIVQLALCLVRLYVVFPGWQSQLMLTYASLLFPFWIGYFAVGVAVGGSLRRPGAARRALHVWRAPLALGATAATAGTGVALLLLHYPGSPYASSFLGGTGAFLNPVLPLFVLSAVAMVAALVPPVLRRSRLLAAGVASLSEQSLGVYIVHPIPLFFLGTFVFQGHMSGGGAPEALMFAALVSATVIAALITVRLLRATRAAAVLGTSYAPLPLSRWRRPARAKAA
ncbi:MAG TPA: acyltransferase [Candidatus Dormibacteraeota bacterium]